MMYNGFLLFVTIIYFGVYMDIILLVAALHELLLQALVIFLCPPCDFLLVLV